MMTQEVSMGRGHVLACEQKSTLINEDLFECIISNLFMAALFLSQLQPEPAAPNVRDTWHHATS
jgi:hypothetical protein